MKIWKYLNNKKRINDRLLTPTFTSNSISYKNFDSFFCDDLTNVFSKHNKENHNNETLKKTSQVDAPKLRSSAFYGNFLYFPFFCSSTNSLDSHSNWFIFIRKLNLILCSVVKVLLLYSVYNIYIEYIWVPSIQFLLASSLFWI